MRLLFVMDRGDHDRCTHTFSRPSARAVIRRGGLVAMVHSLKYNYYKFPGGGIEPGETREEAVIRETREETGLTIRPGSLREYGRVRRVQRSDLDETERFLQDNYYYFAEAEPGTAPQQLDGYEDDESFTLEFVRPEHAIAVNRGADHGGRRPDMVERDARVLELLLAEGQLGG